MVASTCGPCACGRVGARAAHMFNVFMPGLSASPWRDAGDFSFATLLEEHFDELRGELDAAIANGLPMQPFGRSPDGTPLMPPAWTGLERDQAALAEPARCGELRAAASCGGRHGSSLRRDQGALSVLVPRAGAGGADWRAHRSHQRVVSCHLASTSRLGAGCVWRVRRGRGASVGASRSTTAIPTKPGTITRRSGGSFWPCTGRIQISAWWNVRHSHGWRSDFCHPTVHEGVPTTHLSAIAATRRSASR